MFVYKTTMNEQIKKPKLILNSTTIPNKPSFISPRKKKYFPKVINVTITSNDDQTHHESKISNKNVCVREEAKTTHVKAASTMYILANILWSI